MSSRAPLVRRFHLLHEEFHLVPLAHGCNRCGRTCSSGRCVLQPYRESTQEDRTKERGKEEAYGTMGQNTVEQTECTRLDLAGSISSRTSTAMDFDCGETVFCWEPCRPHLANPDPWIRQKMTVTSASKAFRLQRFPLAQRRAVPAHWLSRGVARVLSRSNE